MAWRDFAERTPDLPVGFVVQSATTTALPGEVIAAYEAPFPNAESKAGAARFPLIVPTSEESAGGGADARRRRRVSRWDKPALVAFSDRDPVFPYPRSGELLCDLIPGAGEQIRIEGAAHFLQEDRGEHVAEMIVRFGVG
jgi:haloalkane dehalogenase